MTPTWFHRLDYRARFLRRNMICVAAERLMEMEVGSAMAM